MGLDARHVSGRLQGPELGEISIERLRQYCLCGAAVVRLHPLAVMRAADPALQSRQSHALKALPAPMARTKGHGVTSPDRYQMTAKPSLLRFLACAIALMPMNRQSCRVHAFTWTLSACLK